MGFDPVASGIRCKGDGRGFGFMVRLYGGADLFGVITLLSAVVFPLSGGER